MKKVTKDIVIIRNEYYKLPEGEKLKVLESLKSWTDAELGRVKISLLPVEKFSINKKPPPPPPNRKITEGHKPE